MKKCPFCAEEIQTEAMKCKHCGEWLNNESPKELFQKTEEYENSFTSLPSGKYQHTENLISQFNIIFGGVIVSLCAFLFGSEIFPNSGIVTIITALSLLAFSLAFYVQVGRIASYLNRSVITWVGICFVFHAFGAIYAFIKLPKLLRESVYS